MKKLYPFSFPRKRKTFNFKSIVLGFAMLIGGKEMASAQVSTYTFSQSSGTYTPITGTVLDAATGNTSTTNLNSNIYPLSLPFDFVFNGTTYNSVNISTNGFITFGATAPTATTTSLYQVLQDMMELLPHGEEILGLYLILMVLQEISAGQLQERLQTGKL